MKKKILIGFVAFFGLVIASLFAIPYFFKDEIKAKIEKSINENLNANVGFEDADLSLFKAFPDADVSIKKLLIINKAPFAGDTLAAFDELHLKMSITELFNGKTEPINLNSIFVKNGKATILFNENGVGNFDIAIKNNQKPENTEQSKPFNLSIENYELENFSFQYFDARSKINMQIKELNHVGKGNFKQDILDLDTKTSAKISLGIDKMSYMKNVSLTLNAILGIDLKNSKYSFKNNEAKINQLPLSFNGFIQLLPTGQLYDLQFKTPTSSFKNFLGLIPEAYSGSINNVKTTGDFTVSGFAKGQLTDTTVPKFNIAITSHNASFQYPDLPKMVKNIVIDTKIVNESGLMNDTFVNLDKLSFAIDQDVFNAKATIKNVATNAMIDAQLKGVLNLGNFAKAYPVKLSVPLSGILNANVSTNFDMKSVENSQYENIKNAGNLSLSGFNYAGDGLAKPMFINNAAIVFNPNKINLTKFVAKTGKSDLNATGTLDNFYGFIFKNQVLKANFNLQSNQFLVSDFMAPTPVNSNVGTTSNSEKPVAKTNEKQAIKIPAFLDCIITANANTVVYDNLNLKNVSGKLIIKNQTVQLQNVKTNIFDGTIGINGLVSTVKDVPSFDMKLSLDKVDILQSFTQLEMLKKIAPIAGVIGGKLTSNITLNGNLNAKEFTPDLKTLSGDLLGQLLNSKVNPGNSQVLSALTQNVKFLDASKLNLNDVKAMVSFTNGKVNVKPFKIKYQDIVAEVGGSHGFDQNMDYTIKMDVPAKYLGSEVTKILDKLSPTDAAKIKSIPVNALLNGNFKAPKVTTDMKSAMTNLTTQLIQAQKAKLLNQGTTALGNILGGKKNQADTTKIKKQDAVKNTANQVLNGLFKKKN